EPARHIPQMARAGGDSVTFHLEATGEPPELAALARRHGLGAGLAFNPETPVEEALAAAEDVDLVLCMSIHPGYSGHAFMPGALDRMERLRGALPERTRVQVDGGVKPENAAEVRAAGADLLVVGSGIFAAPDIASAYRAAAVS